jgi:hypothetical protein
MGDTVAQRVPCEQRQACLIGGLNGVAEPPSCELNSSLAKWVSDSRRRFAGLLNCTPALQDTTNETVTRRSNATFRQIPAFQFHTTLPAWSLEQLYTRYCNNNWYLVVQICAWMLPSVDVNFTRIFTWMLQSGDVNSDFHLNATIWWR